jgi:uncharacterized protein YprB with RNaseH-like and TPR domain
MKLILDIETFALDGADAFLEPVSAPSNYKDPAKIQQYCEEKRVELLSRCALDPDLCRIVAAGWSHDGNDVGVEIATHENQERGLLEELWFAILKSDAVIGFNVLAFDLPVMIRRSQYLGVSVPELNLDRYRTPHIDLMERLSFNGKIKAHSLDFYCKRFGIDVPDEHSGKDVDALVKAGDWNAVAAHCRADITRTKALAARLGYINISEPAGVL